MTKSTVTHSTFVLERRVPAEPARVWEAFADPDLKRRWYAEGDQHDVEEYASELRPGADQRLRYRFREGTPFAGLSVTNSDTILEVVPGERIIASSKMAFSEKCISVALITTEIQRDGDGTNVVLTFQGAFLPGADGPQIREMGWNAFLDRLVGQFENEAASVG
jgi:uncharacterized protein YndB with AHSA1/START domain